MKIKTCDIFIFNNGSAFLKLENLMKLQHLSNQVLHFQTKLAADKERLSTIEVLWHLRENEKRMLYAQMGFKDLKEYCIKELKFSEGSAWRRISAMSLLKEIPEVETKIQNGDLNLTQISMMNTHCRQLKSTKNEKQEILASLENQTTKVTERILAERKPDGFVLKPVEIEKPVKGNKTEVTFVIDEDLQKDLEEIQVLLGKPLSKLELFKMMTAQTLENLKKEKCRAQPPRSRIALTESKSGVKEGKLGLTQCNQGFAESKPESKSRYISKVTFRKVKERDQHQCQYMDPETKKKCSAQYHLQIEHKIPFAKGGSSELQNLELLCPVYNRLRAAQHFGFKKMENYFPSLRGTTI